MSDGIEMPTGLITDETLVKIENGKETPWWVAKLLHDRAAEIERLKAEVERLRAALERAEGNFYNMANAIDDADYRGSVPGLDGIVVGHFEKFNKGHVEWLVKYAEEARAALSVARTAIRRKALEKP